jgi:hypothetical protein
MRFYLEINGEKHYLDEGVVKKNALYEGKITPLTRLEIKRENEPTLDNETISAFPTGIDDSETNIETNGIADSKDSTDVVEPIPESAVVPDEFPADDKESNETLPKSEDTENPIHISEETGSQESSITEVNESVIKKNPRKSKLDPYLSVMKELIEKNPDITSVQVYNELCEAGFDGGKTIVSDRLNQIRRRELESKENHDQTPHQSSHRRICS